MFIPDPTFFPSRIPDPDADFLPIPDPGSRGQKGTGSRIRIRNTDYLFTSLNWPFLFAVLLTCLYIPALWVLRIVIVYPGCRILIYYLPGPTRTIKRVGGIFVLLFCSHKCHKIENYLIFFIRLQKNVSQLIFD
jgi:hypothetical protein